MRAIETLSQFVFETCGDRPPSHSAEHMKRVANLSRKILDEQYPNIYHKRSNNARRVLVATIAWLHDVCDHKYDDKILLIKFNRFISKFCADFACVFEGTIYKKLFNPMMIDTMINMISFSGERGRPEWFAECKKLIGVRGMLVRNIVSDADKLDALGMHGLHRCLSYIKETDKNLSDDEAKNILRPFNEKNLKIRAQYLRTSYAKKLGQYLLTEMNVDKM